MRNSICISPDEVAAVRDVPYDVVSPDPAEHHRVAKSKYQRTSARRELPYPDTRSRDGSSEVLSCECTVVSALPARSAKGSALSMENHVIGGASARVGP